MAAQETTADIIAEMRRIGLFNDWRALIPRPKYVRKDCVNRDVIAKALLSLADRIESAHKRERDVMFDALVRIGNWCAQDLAENAYVSDSSGNYLKTLNGLCEVCRPFMRKANKLKKYGGTNG